MESEEMKCIAVQSDWDLWYARIFNKIAYVYWLLIIII